MVKYGEEIEDKSWYNVEKKYKSNHGRRWRRNRRQVMVENGEEIVDKSR
jgi:hypothetical protein